MKKTTLAALNRAIAKFDGAPGLARAMGLPSYKAVQAWKNSRVPAEHCPHIELLTGEQCELLRPDVMWHVLRARPCGGGKAVVSSAEGGL